MNSKAHMNDVAEAPLYNTDAFYALYIPLFSEIPDIPLMSNCGYENHVQSIIIYMNIFTEVSTNCAQKLVCQAQFYS